MLLGALQPHSLVLQVLQVQLYTDVTSQQLQCLISLVNTRLVHMITYFSRYENGAFLLVEALFAVSSTTEVKKKSFEQNSSPTLVRFSNCYCNWVLWLSCDNVPKFNWVWQLSGGGSNNLNSRNLPGHLFYSMGMRLRSLQFKNGVSIKKTRMKLEQPYH